MKYWISTYLYNLLNNDQSEKSKKKHAMNYSSQPEYMIAPQSSQPRTGPGRHEEYEKN